MEPVAASLAAVVGLGCCGLAAIAAGVGGYFLLRPKRPEKVDPPEDEADYTETVAALADETRVAIRQIQSQTEQALRQIERRSIGGDK